MNLSVVRVKSGKFGHTIANTGSPDETAPYEPLTRIFTVCLVNLFFIPIIELWNKQGGCPNLAVSRNIPDFTLMICSNVE